MNVVSWIAGRPKKPGIYWICTSLGSILAGKAWRNNDCCKHCDSMEVYCVGGGGAPIETISRENFWYAEIPIAPKDGWHLEPQRGWNLYKTSKHPGTHLLLSGSSNCKILFQNGNVVFGADPDLGACYFPISIPTGPNT